jgi:hypothetical protein
MLDGIVDRANVVYFLLAVAALVLLAAGWTTRRMKFWAYAAAVVGAMLAFWLLCALVITDRRQIALNLDAMANAIVKNDADAVRRHFSKDLRQGALTRDDLAKRVAAAARTYKVHNVSIWGKSVTVNGPVAEAIFNFRVDTDEDGKPASAKAKFVQEDGAWKVQEIQILKLGTTERQFVPGVD